MGKTSLSLQVDGEIQNEETVPIYQIITIQMIPALVNGNPTSRKALLLETKNAHN